MCLEVPCPWYSLNKSASFSLCHCFTVSLNPQVALLFQTVKPRTHQGCTVFCRNLKGQYSTTYWGLKVYFISKVLKECCWWSKDDQGSVLQFFLSTSTSSWTPGAQLGKCEQNTELYLKLTLLPKIKHLSLIKYVIPTASTKLFWTTYTLFSKGSLRESLLG